MTHKENCPLRPVVSCINSPAYFLSKTLNNILNESLPKPNSFMKNFIDLIDRIKNVKIPHNYVLLSLDVSSLFTNVPIHLVLTGIEKRWH